MIIQFDVFLAADRQPSSVQPITLLPEDQVLGRGWSAFAAAAAGCSPCRTMGLLRRAIKFNQFNRTVRNVLTTVSVIQMLGHLSSLPIIGYVEIIGILTVILGHLYSKSINKHVTRKEVQKELPVLCCLWPSQRSMTNDSSLPFNHSVPALNRG